MEGLEQVAVNVAGGVPWVVVVLCIFVPGVLGWAVKWALGRTWELKQKADEPAEKTAMIRLRMWWRPLLIFPAMGVGAATGLGIGLVDGWGYGAFVGAASGVLGDEIVRWLKARLGALLSKLTRTNGGS